MSVPLQPHDEVPLPEQLFRLSRLLRTAPRSAEDLAVATGQSPETTQAQLGLLQTLEPTLQVLPGTPPLYVITGDWTAAERLTLRRGLGALAERGAEPTAPLRELAARLSAPLPAHVQAALPPLAVPAQQPLHLAEVLPLVTQAWLDGRGLRFDYLRPGRAHSRRRVTLQPVLVHAHPVTLEPLLTGRETTGRRAQRTFRLGRMLGVTVLEGAPTPAPVPAPPTPQGPSLTAQLRFVGRARLQVLEGRFAHLSEPLIHADGSVEVTLQAPAGSRSVLPWLLSWGAGVQVLGPAPLREQWQTELRAALAAAEAAPPADAGAA
ncbi:helix-turn-helix transcriptional regulator [Deinococcus multiflagellatus]|uniref:Helix-turn-helix transcriptional regulator n=1 Tax=Deinococcus multiflagellatus TaxID=1656887 RepID=A0ABW1ZF96_9DEIO|nr:WYL domain-containing protein [Deinococcus multiflagellatus]MBZ9712815.1 WYL domain-containing protein [Deinococcus multiflagellatus]